MTSYFVTCPLVSCHVLSFCLPLSLFWPLYLYVSSLVVCLSLITTQIWSNYCDVIRKLLFLTFRAVLTGSPVWQKTWENIATYRTIYHKPKEHKWNLNRPDFLRHQDEKGLPTWFILFILVPYQYCLECMYDLQTRFPNWLYMQLLICNSMFQSRTLRNDESLRHVKHNAWNWLNIQNQIAYNSSSQMIVDPIAGPA